MEGHTARLVLLLWAVAAAAASVASGECLFDGSFTLALFAHGHFDQLLCSYHQNLHRETKCKKKTNNP